MNQPHLPDDPASASEPLARQADGLEPAASSPDAELADLRQQITQLKAELAATRKQQNALGNELQHRVRNMLAVIRTIYRRSREAGASQDEFAEHFEGRLDTIARYYSYVDNVGSPGIEIEDILRNELLESNVLDGPGCTLSGPPVYLLHKSAELMGLVVHELTTNSIKFGAIAQGGSIAVSWSMEEREMRRHLRFLWAENGVSVAVPAPRPNGFGRQLIEEALPYQLDATTSFLLRPGGVECLILLPLPGSDGQDFPPEDTGVTSTIVPRETE